MRAAVTLLHRWFGLAIAGFLFVSGLTGAVISWDHELDEWLNPHLNEVASVGPAIPALELAGAGAWRRGQLVYHDQPLRAVLADLERYRGGRVLASDRGLAAARVTGTFRLADPEAAFDAIAATLGVTVTRWPLLALVRPA